MVYEHIGKHVKYDSRQNAELTNEHPEPKL